MTERRLHLQLLVLAALLCVVVGIGYLDFTTGPRFGLALFYLLPVVIAAGRLGKWWSLVVAFGAAATWFFVDVTVDGDLPTSLWNGFTRLAIFASQGWLVASIDEERRRERELARLDAVTGLPNSRAFTELLNRLPLQSAPCCLAYIDLDNFKQVNDRFGHSAGDAVLTEMADALRAAIRSDDIAARVGGDEFAVLMRDADHAVAEFAADRIVGSARAIGVKYPDAGLGASVGFAVCPKGAHVSADDFIRVADAAMYEAKERHKGSYVVRSTAGDGRPAR